MPFISPKTQHHLEWRLILNTLADLCQSEHGQAKARDLGFCQNQSAVHKRLALTSESRALLDLGTVISFHGVLDVRPALTRASRSARLDAEELVAIGRLLESARKTSENIEVLDNAPALTALAAPLYFDVELEHALVDLFDENLELVSNASPALRQLRQAAQDLHGQLRNTLNRYLSDEDILPMLQEDYFTLRDERYVLPLKSRHKNHVDGIVHGWSQTGSTVYVEPRRVIEANNKLMLAQAEVDAEINRILKALTARIGAAAKDIHRSFELLTELDVVWAMGRLSQRLDGIAPVIDESGVLKLEEFRHPALVLSDQSVVANSLELSKEKSVLVITGPNTGGKTVALKSVGLLLLMAHAGLHIPAKEASRIPFVPGVYSDIGDEQSLESQHSTFSGHIANLKTIISHASPGAVVLLDELVVGTDPGQGAALAQSIAEHFEKMGCLLVITTHYETLKGLALESDRFRNGAMGLDTNTSKPTYLLTLDLPGMSSALRTAERLGLPNTIVERAAELVDPNQREIQGQLQKLDALRNDLETERIQVKQLQVQLNVETAALKKREEKLNAKWTQLKDRAHDTLLKEAQALREAVREQSKSIKRQSVKQVHLTSAKSAAQAAIDHVFQERKAHLSDDAPKLDTDTLKQNQKVFVISMQRQGIITEIDAPRARCRVQMGQFSMLVALDDLRRAQAGQKNSVKKTADDRENTAMPSTKKPTSAQTIAPQSTNNTVDLRGQTVDESLDSISKFLDDCLLRNEAGAYIIHGHGGGHLKRATRSFLATLDYVLEQRPGDRYEGGDGVTVVRLR